MMLSLRLRRRERETMFHLGCGRWTITGIQAELLILLACSALLAVAASRLALENARAWIQTLSG